jgi:hypothetical protein
MTLMWLLARVVPIAAVVLSAFVFVNAVIYVRRAFFKTDV